MVSVGLRSLRLSPWSLVVSSGLLGLPQSPVIFYGLRGSPVVYNGLRGSPLSPVVSGGLR